MTRGPYALALAVAALCALAAVTYAIYDPDIWQHLAVGREIWRTHAIPHTQIWTWPTHGAPDVLPSWLFRVALYPFWAWGGVHGLFVWRWLTTLVAFGLLWAAARRMGATGVAPLFALVWCVLLYRQRSQARPETFIAMLAGAELLLLEARRRAFRAPLGGPRARRLAWGLVPIALLWANAHISYYLAFAIAAGYGLDDLAAGGARRRAAGAFALAGIAALAACFVNPFGWRALAQPFEYFFVWRNEPIYHSIGELSPIDWSMNVRNGLPLLFALVVAGVVARARRGRVDWAQLVVLGVGVPQAILGQRFVGVFAVLIAPFFARDLRELAGRVRWPAWLAAPPRRAALAALACVALCVPELARPFVGLGYGVRWDQYPVRACDWIAEHDVRGRSFNNFSYGGYLLWRFFPDPTRLPFMDIHQAGTREIRYLYAFAGSDSNAWHDLDRRFRIDWVLMVRSSPAHKDILDFLDADSSTWALVFADDAAALYLRRDGSCARQARTYAYRWLPGGTQRLDALGEIAWRDSAARAQMRVEADRAVAASEWNARSRSFAANVALADGRFADAAAQLEAAGRQNPALLRLHERLGLAKLYTGDPARALAEFEAERRANRAWPAYDFRRGEALAALGRVAEARAAYARALALAPGNGEARDSLAALDRR